MTPSDTGVVIALKSVTRSFGSIMALNKVSLALKEGEFFALLGPSGCGKTTLLRMIAGFETPDQGHILLDGNDITQLRPSRRPVNMMFQSYALFPHMTVQSNIAYGLEMEKLAKPDITRRVEAILGITGLTEIAARKPDQLSGGQRQRVALARALVKEPRVLLLDEPLAALDRKLRGQMQLELKRLQNELGVTFVVVTHDQEEALAMADRIAVMNAGSIVQLGTPQSLYNHPQSQFVADFIGVSNFLSGHYVAGKLETQHHGLFQLDQDTTLPEHADALIAIRPEKLSITTERDRTVPNSIQGRIIDKIFGGQSVSIVIEITGCPEPWVVRVDADKISTKVAEGDEVWCNWPSSAGRLLPTQS